MSAAATRGPQVVVATSNPGKLREIRTLLADLPVELCALDAFQGRALDAEERRARFTALSPDDLQRTAEQCLKPTGAQVTVVGALDPLKRAGLRRRIHRHRAPDSAAGTR